MVLDLGRRILGIGIVPGGVALALPTVACDTQPCNGFTIRMSSYRSF